MKLVCLYNASDWFTLKFYDIILLKLMEFRSSTDDNEKKKLMHNSNFHLSTSHMKMWNTF